GAAKGTAKASASALASGVLFNMGALCKENPGRSSAREWRGKRGWVGWQGRPTGTGKRHEAGWSGLKTSRVFRDNENRYHSTCLDLFQSRGGISATLRTLALLIAKRMKT
ncbi:MAG: hypothetical protein LBV73_28450, partial [Paraburkholderia sp.]|nr:hypothetical protein [Paraburkholderia sp.]